MDTIIVDPIKDSTLDTTKPVYTRICRKCNRAFTTNSRTYVHCEKCQPFPKLDGYND